MIGQPALAPDPSLSMDEINSPSLTLAPPVNHAQVTEEIAEEDTTGWQIPLKNLSVAELFKKFRWLYPALILLTVCIGPLETLFLEKIGWGADSPLPPWVLMGLMTAVGPIVFWLIYRTQLNHVLWASGSCPKCGYWVFVNWTNKWAFRRALVRCLGCRRRLRLSDDGLFLLLETDKQRNEGNFLPPSARPSVVTATPIEASTSKPVIPTDGRQLGGCLMMVLGIGFLAGGPAVPWWIPVLVFWLALTLSQ